MTNDVKSQKTPPMLPAPSTLSVTDTTVKGFGLCFKLGLRNV